VVETPVIIDTKARMSSAIPMSCFILVPLLRIGSSSCHGLL
jgi:hypothetical protein